MANRNIPLTCAGHTRPVVHLSFSPMLEDDGKFLLVSSCKDGNPMLRDWTGDWIGTFVGHKGAVWSTKVCRDGSKAATGSADFSAKVWDTFSGDILHTFPHNHIVRTVTLSPSASHLITGGNEKKLRLFDLTKANSDPVELKLDDGSDAHSGTIKSVVWDAERAVGISASEDKTIRWWDLRNRACIHTLKVDDPIASMELSISNNTLVTTYGKTAAFIPLIPNEGSLSNGKADHWYHSLSLPHPVSSASLHPTLGDRFVAGNSSDPWVRVYDLESGKEQEVYKGHHGPVHCVEYSPDGEMYATGSEDGTIRLWQTHPGTNYGLWRGADEA